MIRLVRAEFTKLATTRLIYGLAAAMAAFAVLPVIAGVASAGQRGNPPLSADSLPMLIVGPVMQLPGPALLLGILGMASVASARGEARAREGSMDKRRTRRERATRRGMPAR